MGPLCVIGTGWVGRQECVGGGEAAIGLTVVMFTSAVFCETPPKTPLYVQAEWFDQLPQIAQAFANAQTAKTTQAAIMTHFGSHGLLCFTGGRPGPPKRYGCFNLRSPILRNGTPAPSHSPR